MKKQWQMQVHPVDGKEIRREKRELRVLELAERSILFLLLLWIFIFSLSERARAAESSVIESVDISFQSDFGGQEEIQTPNITVQQNDVEIADIHYIKNYDAWVPGQKLRVEVLLKAKDGKVFARNLNRDKVKVNGANYVEAGERKGNQLMVKADFVPKMALGNVQYAAWNAAHTMGIWQKVRFAPSYTVTLYGDNQLVKEYTGVKTTYVDFAQDMKDLSKVYYYEVKAAPFTEEEKKYFKEGQFVTATTDEVEEPKGDKPADLDEEDNIEAYIAAGNGVLPNAWRYVGRHWYFIDAQGKVKKGWLERGGEWFFLNNRSGAMETGLVETSTGKFAYFKQDGSMISNTWLQTGPDVWYYFGLDGYMYYGWWKNSDGNWFYLNQSLGGKMQIGWLKWNEKWYYMDKNGVMQTGFRVINGKTYYFNESGEMLTNTTVQGKRLGADGAAA